MPAAAATPTHGEQARPGGAAGEASTQGERQRRQLASPDSLWVFLFLGEGCGDPLLLLPASHPVCWRGLAEPTPEERGRTAGGRRQHTVGKPATADNRPPAKLTGAKDQRKPCGAPFANVVETDRKSTRLNSSHLGISYAVF